MCRKTCEYRWRILFVIFFVCGSIHATTFAERHQYKKLFETAPFRQLEDACIEIRKNLEKCQQQGNRQQEAEYTGLLSECLIAQGQYAEAMSQAQRAKELYNNLLNKAKNKNNLLLKYNYALVCHIIAQLSSSLVYDIQQQSIISSETTNAFNEYFQMLNETEDEEIKRQNLNRLFHSLFSVMECSMRISLQQRNYINVVDTGERLLSEISKAYPEQATSRFDYLDTQLFISYAYSFAENYEQALNYLFQIKETVEKNYGKDNLYYALVLYRIGGIYYSLHNLAEASGYLYASYNIFNDIGYTRHPVYAEVLETIGNLCLSNGENYKAKELYDYADAIIKETCGVDSYFYYLNQYFYTYYDFATRNYSKVAHDIKELLQNDVFLRETGDSHVIGAYAMFFEAAYRSNNFTDIYHNVPIIDAYVQNNRQNIGPFEACKLYIAVGRAYRYQWQYQEANTYFYKALEFFREMSRRSFVFLTEKQRNNYILRDESRIETILLQNNFAKDDYSGSLATLLFDAALFQKSMLLNTSVNMARIIEEKGPESLKRDMRRLQLMMQSNLQTSEEKQACRQLEQQIQQEARKYGDFMDFIDYTWRDVKKALSTDEIAIEFVCSQLGKNTVVSAEVISNSWNVPRHVSLFTYSTYDRNSRNILTGLFREAMYKKIFPMLKPGDNVYFAPAGDLFMLPIEYMELPNGKRMDEVYQMHRVSSTRELITKNNRAKSQRNIVLFGGLNYNSSLDDMEYQASVAKELSRSQKNSGSSHMWSYLKNSLTEVEKIAIIMQSAKYQVSTFTQEKGVEEQFKALSETHTGIIHIATHGFYKSNSYSNMENAGLVFAGANNFVNSSVARQQGLDDGILTISEIANLNLIGTDLVVLSACQTGLGKVTNEGVFGLQRAFKKAGVQSILMSLWKVDDEATQVLMTAFYQYLKEGNNKRDALRKAQEQVRQRKFLHEGKMISGEDIHFWGGFVLID